MGVLWSDIVRELRNKKDLKNTDIWSAKGAKSSFGMGQVKTWEKRREDGETARRVNATG